MRERGGGVERSFHLLAGPVHLVKQMGGERIFFTVFTETVQNEEEEGCSKLADNLADNVIVDNGGRCSVRVLQ